MARKLLEVLGRWVVRFPREILLLYAVLAAASMVGWSTFVWLKTDQNDLVAADLEYNRRYLRFLKDFADLEFLYVVVRVEGEPERAIQVAENLARELRALKKERHVKSVFHRVPLEEIGYGLLFQEVETLEELARSLQVNREQFRTVARLSSFEQLFRFFAENLNEDTLAGTDEDGTTSENGSEIEDFAEWGFRLMSLSLSSVEDALNGDRHDSLESGLESGLSLRERGYLATEGDAFLLVEVLPDKDPRALELIPKASLAAIRDTLDRVRARFPGVELGLTGRPVFQADEMITTDHDIRRATVAALIGVFLLFVLFFRRLKRPLLAVLTLLVAILLTFGVVSVTIKYLTLLSIVFAAMLVGLGIDFGIHFVARYQEELAGGKRVDDAVRTTILRTGTSIGTGALTTAAAFYTTLLVDFKGLRELGFIAGTGVLLCFLSMVTLLPALLLEADRRAERRGTLGVVPVVQVPLLARFPSRPRAVVMTILGLTLAGLVTLLVLSRSGVLRFEGLPYNANLLDLQARGLESVEYEMLLIKESDTATWYAAFIAPNLDEVRETVEKLEPLRKRGIVGKIESLPTEQRRKMAILQSGLREVADVAFATPSSEVDPAALAASLRASRDAVEGIQDLLLWREDGKSRTALKEVEALRRRLDALSVRVEDRAAMVTTRLPETQKRWFGEFQALLEKLRKALKFGPLAPENLPSLLRERYVSSDGTRFLVYAYPRKDIWEETNMEEFISEMYAVDPEVTGTPVQVYESAWRMRDGFLWVGLYSFGVVFLLLFLDLRRLRDTLLAMVPLIVGLFWMVEFLPFLGLEFNLANFFAVPILIGCGIDGGVHVVHRFQEERSAREVGRTTCSAVTLSFLTTMVGFGAMGFASHRGVASLGNMMVLGLVCLLLASVVLLPSLLRLRVRNVISWVRRPRRSRR